MSQNTFTLTILSPEKRIFKGEVISLIAPGELGSFGVLAHHAPLISTLRPGVVTIKKTAEEIFNVKSEGSGFLEVSNNKVTMLLDAVA